MIKRREFIAGLGSATAWPVVARAQQPAMPVIGFLSTQSADDYKDATAPFLSGLKETAMSRARTWWSSIVMRTINMICRRSQPIGLVLCPAVFDRHVLALDIAGFLQALQKRNGEVLVLIISWSGAEISDHGHHRLLRPRHHRPRRRAPEPYDELPSPHP